MRKKIEKELRRCEEQQEQCMECMEREKRKLRVLLETDNMIEIAILAEGYARRMKDLVREYGMLAMEIVRFRKMLETE